MSTVVREAAFGADRAVPRPLGVRLWRIGWTVFTILLTQGLVCGAALFPVALLWRQLPALTPTSHILQTLALSMFVVPLYVLFALLLMFVSAMAARGLQLRTPEDAQMRIADVEWPLLHWVRNMAAIHIVRIFAGPLFRGSPVWTAYLRLAGARLGRRVYVNSLAVTDYNLLTVGDDVVIGDGVHLSGHTVEGGIVKTASTHIGSNVTLGLGSVIGIGVDVGDGCRVGALSFVPKYTRLEAGADYAGIPVQRIGIHPQPRVGE